MQCCTACGVSGVGGLEKLFHAMSVVRRNTFDLFDEESDLLSTSKAKTTQKKKRRKRRTSVESSVSQSSQRRAESQPTADHEKHEVGPEG